MKNIVILISGGGSNMAALVRAAEREQWAKRYDARVALVISNKADAKGLDFARAQGIATAVLDHKAYASRDAFDAALAELISRSDTPGQPALVVLAGFMRILTPGDGRTRPWPDPGAGRGAGVAGRHGRHVGGPRADAGALDLPARYCATATGQLSVGAQVAGSEATLAKRGWRTPLNSISSRNMPAGRTHRPCSP